MENGYDWNKETEPVLLVEAFSFPLDFCESRKRATSKVFPLGNQLAYTKKGDLDLKCFRALRHSTKTDPRLCF